MAETNRAKVKRLEREVRRRDRKIEIMRKENAALLGRALDAERAGRIFSSAYLLLTVRMGLTYGEDVMDKARAKSIGKRLTLPKMGEGGGPALLAKWQSKAMHDGDGNTIIAVGLRDDPDDHKTDAELAAEAQAVAAEKGGGQHDE